MPGCGNEATRGETWTEPSLQPIVSYRSGVEMALTVRDIAVVLSLCGDHATGLSDVGWQAMLGLLKDWGWRPLDDR